MEVGHDLGAIDKRWAIGDFCALLVGIGIRLALSTNTAANPILADASRFQRVSHLASYLFNPLTYAITAVLFAFAVVRVRGIGLWSVFLSFMVGGLLASSFLALM
jgi:hypothetical protein